MWGGPSATTFAREGRVPEYTGPSGSNAGTVVTSFPGKTSGVLREMLATLANVSAAGQRHLMTKMIGIIEHELRNWIRDQSAANRRVLREQMLLLKRESDRLLPDPSGFAKRADSLLALLDAIG